MTANAQNGPFNLLYGSKKFYLHLFSLFFSLRGSVNVEHAIGLS